MAAEEYHEPSFLVVKVVEGDVLAESGGWTPPVWDKSLISDSPDAELWTKVDS